MSHVGSGAEIIQWMTGDRSTAPRDLLGEASRPPLGKKRGPQSGCGGRPRKPDGREEGPSA